MIPAKHELIRHVRTLSAKAIALVGIPLLWIAAYLNAIRVDEQFQITRKLSDQVFSLIIVCDEQGRVVFVNDRILEFTGYTEAEIRTGGATLLVPPELERTHVIAMTAALQRKQESIVTFRSEFCTKNPGERVPAYFRTAVYENDGKWYAQTTALPVAVVEQATHSPEYATP